MQHFFFHVHINDAYVRDRTGTLLSTLGHAFELAVEHARDLIKQDLERLGWLNLCGRVSIEDHTGEVLASVSFEEALEMKRTFH